jgi:NitT/TauT family transport system permease protein/sulfonate transport system permease protein
VSHSGVRDAPRSVKAVVALAFAATLAALWVYGSSRLPVYILPSPKAQLDSAIAFFSSSRRLFHVFATLGSVAASIMISFIVGAALALTAFYLPKTEPLIHHRLSPFLNSFSGIGWTLLAVIWFGVSPATVIFSVSIVLLPFALINLREGLRTLDGELGEMARSFSRSKWRSFTTIIAPALFPFSTATLRIMFGVAWKVALTAELFGGSVGLGYVINLARQEFDTGTIFTVIAFIIVAVYCADRFIFAPMERVTARRYGT